MGPFAELGHAGFQLRSVGGSGEGIGGGEESPLRVAPIESLPHRSEGLSQAGVSPPVFVASAHQSMDLGDGHGVLRIGSCPSIEVANTLIDVVTICGLAPDR
jgi:hypothetical protein